MRWSACAWIHLCDRWSINDQLPIKSWCRFAFWAIMAMSIPESTILIRLADAELFLIIQQTIRRLSNKLVQHDRIRRIVRSGFVLVPRRTSWLHLHCLYVWPTRKSIRPYKHSPSPSPFGTLYACFSLFLWTVDACPHLADSRYLLLWWLLVA